MEQSYSGNDISLSPSQILERLKVLRHLQLLQRGKLQKQQLQYDNELSTTTEIVSHFSNSTSYNTFRTLLESSRDDNEESPARSAASLSRRVHSQDVMEGVSFLNLSQESEFVTNSPVSTRSEITKPAKSEVENGELNPNAKSHMMTKKICLDEMPILSPHKDFETLIVQKLQSEKVIAAKDGKPETKSDCPTEKITKISKKPYLKRGEGMSRFGIQKENFVIQNTKSLPWRQSNIVSGKQNTKAKIREPKKLLVNKNGNNKLKNEVEKPLEICSKKSVSNLDDTIKFKTGKPSPSHDHRLETNLNVQTEDCDIHKKSLKPTSNAVKENHAVMSCKGKTWAAVLSKEQSDFLRQLKQSDYYKNFHSPAKSTISDISCDDYNSKTKYEMEVAEQNLFDLIEKKVTHDSFNLGNPFFNRFLGKKIDTSGESTPLILKKCLSNNPKLTRISPGNISNLGCESSCSDIDNCTSECIECSETCSSVSSSCSCKTVTQNDFSQASVSKEVHEATDEKDPVKKKEKTPILDACQNDCVNKHESNVNMEEMNAKLIATSDLLKDRLRELEDEIETFRRENASLNKIREELDVERQKFYEEKKDFEQKFNEEKVLSEYYLAEEKEKLQKQKQIYERHVREIRGRLSKKEKDEVLNLKKEIQNLKEEIRVKDAKSTSVIARLRNQIKLMEKDKKNLEDETEKLKKENKRIQHNNEITRRLTNLKYLEKINKKLSNMANKDNQIDVIKDPDIRYKSYCIERQSRLKTIEPLTKNILRPRAKSVPNLNVTSRYAKYFSQKDSLSDMEKQNMLSTENLNCDSIECSDVEDRGTSEQLENCNISHTDDENKLEEIYNERFKSTLTPKEKKDKQHSVASPDSTDELLHCNQNVSNFFIRKSKNSIDKSKLLLTTSTSPSYLCSSENSSNSLSSNRMSSGINTYNKSRESIVGKENYIGICEVESRSTTPTLSKRYSSPHNSNMALNKELYCDSRLIPSPEPTSIRSNSSKTNLNPIELTKPDGSRELRFPNGNVKIISADGRYSKFTYYNGDVKENFYKEGKIKYFYAETKTYHTSHADGLEVLEFPDGQIEKRYKDGSTEIRLPNGSIRYYDPKNEHIQEEWRFPDGAILTVSANGEKRIKFINGQIEVHAKDHKRREFPDGTMKLVYNDGTSETRYASGRVRIKDKHGNLIMDSAPD